MAALFANMAADLGTGSLRSLLETTIGARAAERDFRTIVLIDSPMLARLMVDRGVGVQFASTHVPQRLP